MGMETCDLRLATCLVWVYASCIQRFTSSERSNALAVLVCAQEGNYLHIVGVQWS